MTDAAERYESSLPIHRLVLVLEYASRMRFLALGGG